MVDTKRLSLLQYIPREGSHNLFLPGRLEVVVSHPGGQHFLLERALFLSQTLMLTKTERAQQKTKEDTKKTVCSLCAPQPPWRYHIKSLGCALRAIPLLQLRICPAHSQQTFVWMLWLYTAVAPVVSYIHWWWKLLCEHRQSVPAPQSALLTLFWGVQILLFLLHLVLKQKVNQQFWNVRGLLFLQLQRHFLSQQKNYFTFQNCSQPVRISTCNWSK